MNKLISLVTILFITIISLGTQAKVQGSDYEELTYDDLVTQLSQKRDQSSLKKNRQGLSTTYFGLGMVSSLNQLQASGHNYSPSMTGYEFSSGTSLNSEAMRAEANLRFYPQTQAGSETTSLKELGGTIQHRKDLNARWRSKFYGGLSFRFLDFSDSFHQVSIQEISSMLLGGAGIEAKLSSNVSLGGDASLRIPFFGSSTPDKNSLSFGLKLDTSFE